MEELLIKHRKEKKDLQSRITQKKKNATKKTRKGVNDDCERLERELQEQQQTEIEALTGTGIEPDSEDLQLQEGEDPASEEANRLPEPAATASASVENAIAEQEQKSKKPNRHKARLARRAAEQEAEAAAAAEEAANLPDRRAQEMDAMKAHLQRLQLTETFIQPDGHCLYSACALSLPEDARRSSDSGKIGYRDVRHATADFISKHPDEFSPFLEEPLEGYVGKVRDTAEWGGQLELQAIARYYKITINVLQADGRIEKISPEHDKTAVSDIWLAYYRHSFGLGEHYNALQKTS